MSLFVFDKEAISLNEGFSKLILTRICTDPVEAKRFRGANETIVYEKIRNCKIDKVFQDFSSVIPQRSDMIYHLELELTDMNLEQVEEVESWKLHKETRPFLDLEPHRVVSVCGGICICTNSEELRNQIKTRLSPELLAYANEWHNSDYLEE